MAKFLLYTTRPGDRWDLIAYAQFGDAARYGEIIDANRELFSTNPLGEIPTVLEPGLQLRIPLVEDVASPDDVPPWRRG